MIQLSLLMTDWLIWILFFFVIIIIFLQLKDPQWRASWHQVCQQKLAMISMIILLVYTVIGLLDSIHFQITPAANSSAYTLTQTKSLLDLIIAPLGEQDETTYSAPFALRSYNKEILTKPNGHLVQEYPKLLHGGAHLKNPAARTKDILLRLAWGFATGIGFALLINFGWLLLLASRAHCSIKSFFWKIIVGRTSIAWREAMLTVIFLGFIIGPLIFLSTHYHILGTDQVGQDVFYETIKSIRTGLIIGSITTLCMLPFALSLGMLAGYFGGWIDDLIQYIYTTLSSIPGVLLISAAILVLQVYIANHSSWFPTLASRADARLLALCVILGVTGWATLCRLLRGETLKLRELEFVQAAQVLGVGRYKILLHHILPNVMHIILITVVLDFSGLVLAEAVLSYVGAGVDPTTLSWGNMINGARLELSRDPVVWWSLIAALIPMFILVLAANLFADALRDALDPRLN